MPSVTTPAVILSTIRYGESSKVLRVATQEFGVQSAIAKGALRPRSRFGASLQVLSDGVAHLVMAPNRELHLLTAFDLRRVRVGLSRSVSRYSAAEALAELMIRFAPAAEPAEAFDLLQASLDALETCPDGQVEDLALRCPLGDGLGPGFRAVSRGLCPRRRAAARRGHGVQRSRWRRAVPGLRPVARRRTASAPGPCRPRSAGPSFRPPAAFSMCPGLPPTGGSWPGTSSTISARVSRCRRSISGCAGRGFRHDHRDRRAHRPREVRPRRGPDRPPG